jgi:2'-hydroxyisoflavone reductase
MLATAFVPRRLRAFLPLLVTTAAAFGGPGARAAEDEATPPEPSPRPSMLVFGGTNFIGPHLVPLAVEAGFEVVLFNRGKTRPELFPQIEKLRGDRDPDVGAGLEALEGRTFDVVIDTSGHVPRHVRASCERLAASKYYVFVSSLSVYASHDEPGADESAELARLAPNEEGSEDFHGDAFGPLKALCEEEVARAFPQRCAIVRPGLIVGPLDRSDRFTYWISRFERGGEVLVPGEPSDPIRVIDVRDLAKWLVHLASNRIPGIFNAIGPAQPLTMERLVEACQAAAANDATVTFVDADFLAAQGVAPWTDLPVWFPPREPMRGFHLRSIDRALEAGLEFRPIEETAKDTLEWFLTLPEERRKGLRRGLTAEREAELLELFAARPR